MNSKVVAPRGVTSGRSGSEQAPRFDCFNLDYFQTADQVMRDAERLDLGIEMIMEGWGFEFPFNSRGIFVPEWEELWIH